MKTKKTASVIPPTRDRFLKPVPAVTLPDEKKPVYCPILKALCDYDACAWYSSRAGRCAVLSICEIMFSKSVTGGL